MGTIYVLTLVLTSTYGDSGTSRLGSGRVVVARGGGVNDGLTLCPVPMAIIKTRMGNGIG